MTPNTLAPFWTQAMNEEFIRLRKEFAHRFNGSRNSSTIGWSMVLQQMGIEDQVTNTQAKKKWDNLCKKYRDLKNPERIGKSADTPIHWPLFHMMDWACSSGEMRAQTEAAAAAGQLDERTCDSFMHSQVIVVEEELEQSIAANDLEMLEAASPDPKAEQAASPPLSLRPHQSFAPRSRAHLGGRLAPRPPVSPYRKAAAILDGVELRSADALLSIKGSLDALVALQRAQAESLQAATRASERTAAATERQALALERFAALAEKHLGPPFQAGGHFQGPQ